MKKFTMVLFSFLFFALCGCMETSQLNEKAIVQAVGIDKKGEEYTVTIQNFHPEGSGKIAFDASKLNNIIVSDKGQTIGDAIKKIHIHYGKKIFFGNNSIIVIGRKTAEEGINEVFNYFNSNYECRPNVKVIMADGSAEDIVNAQIIDGPTPAVVLERVIGQYKNTASVDNVDMSKIMDKLNNDGAQAHMPIVKIIYDEKKSPQYYIEGTAIFSGDRLVGELNMGRTSGMRWFNNSVKKTDIVIDKGTREKYFVEINKNKTKIRIDIINNIPIVRVNVKAKATIQESLVKTKGGVSIDELEYIEKLCEEKIASDIYSALEYTLREKNTDSLGVSKYIMQQYPKYWKENYSRWSEIMPSVVFVINVKCVFDRIGLDIRG